MHVIIQVGCNFHIFPFISSDDKLELVLAPGPSPLSATFIDPSTKVDDCETCPEAAVVMSYISEHIKSHGGCGLIIDYGSTTCEGHSLRVNF